MRFVKMEGLGNDFILVREEDLPGGARPGQLAKDLCDRHVGIGADGLILACPSKTADIRMRIFNADGSEAEMCGNGIRCFARFVREEGLVDADTMTVETRAGCMVPVLSRRDGVITGVRVDMREPQLDPRRIPVASELERVVGETLWVHPEELTVTCVSMGNPHCVIFVDDLPAAPVARLGPRIETHPFFPNRTNVEFVQVLGESELAMRVWERGAAETLACGTGACASVVASVLNGYSGRHATVHLAGGDLEIEWCEDNNRVYMSGPATTVFRGTTNQEEDV